MAYTSTGSVSSLVTKESKSTQNGKNIYREGAKYAKDVKNKRDLAFIHGLHDFLSDLCAFAVPSSSSGLSGSGTSQSKRSILTLIKADLSMINPDKAWTHQ
jgi:hypothetical protein